MDIRAVNAAQVFKAVERDSSFFLVNSGTAVKHEAIFHARRRNALELQQRLFNRFADVRRTGLPP
jgi:hypothetical protein